MFSALSVTRSEPGRPSWADIVMSKLGTSRVEAVRGEGGFSGHLALQTFGYLRVAHVKLQGAAVRGMRRRGSTGGRQAFSWLAASIGGGFELCYNGRSAVLPPGNLALLDARRTYVTTFAAESEVLWVRIPNAFLEPHCKAASQIIIDGAAGAGRILFDTLTSIAGQAADVRPGQGRSICDALVRMIAAASFGAQAGDPHSPAQVTALQRVKAFALDNLSDDALSADSVAAATGLTTRYINKLFEREGASLMRWVWLQRLEAARAALAESPLEAHAVGHVAYAHGFKSASHFSHAFRRHYGHAPRAEQRARAMRARPEAPTK
jgi:AraC-like DNA-binding protein